MANRTFTLSEAQQLLPVLKSLLQSALHAKQRVEEIDAEFQKVNSRVMMHGGILLDIAPLARLRAERDKLTQTINDSLSEITATGVQVKDFDTGLLDFPCVIEGRAVLLCWKLGEDGITHWHGVDEGFAGRKPITEKIANAGRRTRKLH
jgi:hypothetical protein